MGTFVLKFHTNAPVHNSIEAVLFPAKISYLYFVSKNDGSRQTYCGGLAAKKAAADAKEKLFRFSSHEPTGPFGAKGVGEGSMVCVASAVANAIYNAIGVRMKDLCITQEKVLEGLHYGLEGSGMWR